jgi:hypothetical protein
MPLVLCLVACGSDATRPVAPEGQVAAHVEAPVVLSAVALEVRGATALDFPGGTALVTPVTDGLRAVMLLDEPGPLDFFVTPAAEGLSPTAVVLDVADAARNVPGSLEAYRVVFR